MNFQHLNVKLPCDGEPAPGVIPARVIELFHRWIQAQGLPELLIDVADYSHVAAGPGVVLVGAEADYSLDERDGRRGLRYNRKAELAGSNADRIRQALGATLAAARRIEAELGASGLRFSRQELEVLVNDRALAPNEPAVLATLRAELEPALAQALGSPAAAFSPPADRRSPAGFRIRLAQPFDLEAALARLR